MRVVFTQQQSQPDLPQSALLDHLLDSLTSPSILLFGGCAIALCVLALFGGRKPKGKIARGKFAGDRERRNARERAISQIESPQRNSVALWIREPSGAEFVREGDRSIYYCPPDAKTLYFPDAQRGFAVFGGPGSGKTFSAIDPLVRSAICQGFPIVLYDFKYPNQTERLAGYAQQMGYEVSIFAPGYPESQVCNPLDFLRGEADAETARQIAEVLNANFKRLTGSATGGGDNPFFDIAGIQLTEAILMLAKASKYPDIMMCTCLLQLDSLIDRLNHAQLNYWIRTSFGQLTATAKSPETVASIISTAFVNFNRFMKAGLLTSFYGETTLPLDLNRRQMVVFGMDRQRRDVVAPLVATILHLIVERNLARPRRTPLVVALDEVPTFYLPRLGHWLNESREDGFVGLLGFQNLAQLERMYGKEGARIAIGGCGTKMIFNPQEYEAAEMFSKYLGEEDIRLKQRSRGHSGGRGSSNIADQDRTRKLVDANQFLTQPTGTCVVVTPGLANRRRASLPMQVKVKIPSQELRKVDRATAEFKLELAQLRESNKSAGVTEAELRERYEETNRFLPKPDKAGGKGSSVAVPAPDEPLVTALLARNTFLQDIELED
ncbi:MAG: type IV secretory system conjugative DNA transfer family protein [Synechococcus sp.]